MLHFSCFWDFSAARITPCPLGVTRSCLTELQAEVWHIYFYSQLRNAHCYHSGNNGCKVLLLCAASNENIVWFVRDGAGGTVRGAVVVAPYTAEDNTAVLQSLMAELHN